MAVRAPGTGSTLDVALDTADCGVRLAPPNPSTQKPAYDQTAFASLAQDEQNAASVAPNVAAVTTRYRLSVYKGKPLNWQGQQEWLYTARRVVGLVTLTSLQDQTAYGAEGSLLLIPARIMKLTQNPFQQIAADTFQYGGLVAQVRAQDFGSVGPQQTTQAWHDSPAVHVLLTDASAGQSAPLHYAKGATHFYLAEVRPAGSKPADTVTRLSLTNGLVGLEMRDGGHFYRLVHNPTDASLNYDAALPAGRVWAHRSGEQFRPAWIEPGSKAQGADATPLTGKTVHLTLAAGQHIVLTDDAPVQP